MKHLAALALAAHPIFCNAQGLSAVVGTTEPPQFIRSEVRAGVSAPGLQTSRRLLSPSIEAQSLYAVSRPEPETFAVHDLVTIVIRESLSTDFQAEIESEKGIDVTGNITDFPRLQLGDLLKGRIDGSNVDPEVRLDVAYDSEFEGEGDYARRESMTARLTARVIDVKPNGTLVLEARKRIEADGESVLLVATGVARVDDILADNTVLSSNLYDLHISKQHTGELRRATKKGVLTKVLDLIFNF